MPAALEARSDAIEAGCSEQFDRFCRHQQNTAKDKRWESIAPHWTMI